MTYLIQELCDENNRLKAENAALRVEMLSWRRTAEKVQGENVALREELTEAKSCNEHHKEQFLQSNLELSRVKHREARLRDSLERIVHVADGKSAYQAFSNEARIALKETQP